ncbi:MAG: transcription antitermination factor NusB [Eubacteriales bacterium]
MTRKKAREAAFCLLFESEYHTDSTPDAIYKQALETRDIEKDEYIERVFFGLYTHLSEVDQLIADSSVGWKNDRISKVTMAILRLAVYEMTHLDDIPVSISINEAVDLGKKYDYEGSSAFINGVLGSIEKKQGLSERKNAK